MQYKANNKMQLYDRCYQGAVFKGEISGFNPPTHTHTTRNVDTFRSLVNQENSNLHCTLTTKNVV